MPSQRESELSAIHDRISAIEITIEHIHALLATALQKATIPSDKHHVARFAIYQEVAKCLNKDALLGLHADALKLNDVEQFFTTKHTNTLHSFYKEYDPDNLLTNDDKEFFDYIFQIFRTLTISRYHYQNAHKAIEAFTPDQMDTMLISINAIHLDFLKLHTKLEALDQTSENIQALTTTANTLYQDMLASLKAYQTNCHTFSSAYLKMETRFNQLSTLKQQLLKKGEILETKKIVEVDDRLVQDIRDYNAEVDAYNEHVKVTCDTYHKLCSGIVALHTNIENKNQSYNTHYAELNREIAARNAAITEYTLEIDNLQPQLTTIPKALTDIQRLHHNAETSLQSILPTEENKPETRCTALKQNGYYWSIYSTKMQDDEWVILAHELKNSLQKLSLPIPLRHVGRFTSALEDAVKQKEITTTKLTHYKPDNLLNDDSETYRDLINKSKSDFTPIQNALASKVTAASSIEPMILPEISPKPAPVVLPSVDIYNGPGVIKITKIKAPAKNPGFLKRHWKALLIGTLIGAAIVGIATATILTFGIAGIVAAGTITTALGIGTTVGSVAGGAILGMAITSSGARVADARIAKRNHYKIDISEPVEEARISPREPAPPVVSSPRNAGVTERGGANDNPFANVNQSPRLRTGKTHFNRTHTLFTPYDHAKTQLFANDRNTQDELKEVINWLKNNNEQPNDVALLGKLANELKNGCDVRLTEAHARCFMQIREEYRHWVINQRARSTH